MHAHSTERIHNIRTLARAHAPAHAPAHTPAHLQHGGGRRAEPKLGGEEPEEEADEVERLRPVC